MDQLIIFILLLVLLITAAYFILYRTESDNIFQGSGEIKSAMNRRRGGSEKVVREIVRILTPYLEESGEKQLETYLHKYYDYSPKKIVDLKNNEYLASGTKYKAIYTLIDDIVNRNDIEDKYDFLEKSNINYMSFVDPDKWSALSRALEKKITKDDIDLIKDFLRDFLTERKTEYDAHKIKDLAREFLESNRIYKLKPTPAKWSKTELKNKVSKGDPEKLYEIDYIGLLPKLRLYARYIAEKKSSKNSIKIVKDFIREKLLKEYPDIRISDAWTLDDLADRLKYYRLDDKMYKSKLLKPVDVMDALSFIKENRQFLKEEELARKELEIKKKEKETEERLKAEQERIRKENEVEKARIRTVENQLRMHENEARKLNEEAAVRQKIWNEFTAFINTHPDWQQYAVNNNLSWEQLFQIYIKHFGIIGNGENEELSLEFIDELYDSFEDFGDKLLRGDLDDLIEKVKEN